MDTYLQIADGIVDEISAIIAEAKHKNLYVWGNEIEWGVIGNQIYDTVYHHLTADSTPPPPAADDTTDDRLS